MSAAYSARRAARSARRASIISFCISLSLNRAAYFPSQFHASIISSLFRRRRARVGRGHGADLETSILETALQAHVENVSGIIRCEQRNTPLVAGRVIASVQEFVHLFGDPLRFSRPSDLVNRQDADRRPRRQPFVKVAVWLVVRL